MYKEVRWIWLNVFCSPLPTSLDDDKVFLNDLKANQQIMSDLVRILFTLHAIDRIGNHRIDLLTHFIYRISTYIVYRCGSMQDYKRNLEIRK